VRDLVFGEYCMCNCLWPKFLWQTTLNDACSYNSLFPDAVHTLVLSIQGFSRISSLGIICVLASVSYIHWLFPPGFVAVENTHSEFSNSYVVLLFVLHSVACWTIFFLDITNLLFRHSFSLCPWLDVPLNYLQ
jgi:hypothetical protein